MDTLLNILKSAAPLLATAVAGPAGGAVVSAIASKFGCEDTVDAVTEALQGASPEQLAKLQEIDLKKIELENADRDSARQAHMAIATSEFSTTLEKSVVPVLALGVVGLAFMLIAVLMFVNTPQDQQQIIIFALGFITSAAGQVLSFYFGSSQGSKEKSKEIEGMMKK